MDPQAFFTEYKEHVLVVLAGVFSIVAALIKMKSKPSAAATWLVASLLCLFLGGGLLYLEYARYHLDADADLNLNNPGALLALGGCLLVAAGAIWSIVNFFRLFGSSPEPVDEAPEKKKKK